jgi:hypothetical protein
VLDDAAMTAALSRSGYLLEQRVADLCAVRHLIVAPNTAYRDPDTRKTRETDLYIGDMKLQRVQVGETERMLWTATAVFGECVNNSAPLVLFEAAGDQSDHGGSRRYIKYSGGLDTVPPKGQGFADFVGLRPRAHHYMAAKMHSQYCTFELKKNSEAKGRSWMATHDDSHHLSFDSLITRWRLALPKSRVKPWLVTLIYGCVILQGDLCTVAQVDGEPQLSHVDYAAYLAQRPRADDAGAEYFVVDVMRESYVPTYLDLINSELSVMTEALKAHPDVLYPTSTASSS